jgi:SAM-dependent methyltransferase/putative flippase GtrA
MASMKTSALPKLKAILGREFSRFLVMGAVNTCFSYSVYSLFLFLGFGFVIASFISMSCGILFSFHTQGVLVFRNPSVRLIYRFVAFWMVIYLCNIGLIRLSLIYGHNPYVAGAMVVPVLLVLSYAMQKYWVFRRPAPWVAAVSDKKHITSQFVCLVCTNIAADGFLDDCRDLYLGKPGAVSYVRCAACGLVQQSPLPGSIDELYDEYPIHAEKSRLYALLQRALLSDAYLNPRRLPTGALVLDYGCGDGWYMAWCKERHVSIVGFELDRQHARTLAARVQLPVYSDMQLLLAAHEHRFDLITLHFVVEHLIDIRGTLAQLSRLLRPGGAIRYVVPNIDSWEFRLFRRKWHGLDPPRHISFPDALHAQRLAQELGLEYEVGQDASCPNGFAGSLPTWLTGHFRRWLFLAVMPLAVILTRLFPSGNRVYILRAPLNLGISAADAPPSRPGKCQAV